MPETFVRRFHVRWGDMDFNAHMRNTAFLDVAADVRMMYFQQQGFPMTEFERLRIGPVIMRDELDYFRELHLLQEINVTLLLAGASEDGSRFRLRNEFLTPEGKLAARVTSTGAWLDIGARKLTAAPPALGALVLSLERSDDFAAIGS